MMTSKKITIFEGPDGCGKTTAALKYAAATGARYVHLGPFPHVKDGLFRLYAEAMMPAVLGYQDVVMDRSWLSEEPYGIVYRGGNLRLTKVEIAMLERLAMRCGAVVVYCFADHQEMVRNFEKRKGQEYLDAVSQLIQVRDIYEIQNTSMTFVEYDYTADKLNGLEPEFIDRLRMPLHRLSAQTAGNWNAYTVLVGESFAEPKNNDPLYQWPFASSSKMGCSHWLTHELLEAGVPEKGLLWTNADQMQRLVKDHAGANLELASRKVIALGAVADQVLTSLCIDHQSCPHPQAHRRFHSGDVYELIKLLKGEGHA